MTSTRDHKAPRTMGLTWCVAGALFALAALMPFQALSDDASGCAVVCNSSNMLVSKYGDPEITEEEGSIRIASAVGQAGLTFERNDLDPHKEYEFRLRGSRQTGTVSLRTRRGSDEFVYELAPDGEDAIVVRNATSFEALVYSDGPFSYRADATLRECGPSPDCSEEASQPGWKVSQYGDAKLRRKGDMVRIDARKDGGALFQRSDLDHGKTYRLRITGIPEASSPLVRIQLDDRVPEVGRAPDRDLELTIAGSERLAVTVYAPSDFHYDVKLSIRECGDCLSNKDLRQLIVAEMPNIETDLKADPLSGIHRLVLWTAKRVDLGNDPSNAIAVLNLLPASQIYQEFWKPNRGGASCGSFAIFFRKVLGLFDIDSFVIDIGYLGTYLTHVTTVVPIKSPSGFKFYVFDPTFGGTYISRDHGYADLQSVLADPESATFDAKPVLRTAIVGDAYWRGFRRVARKFGRVPDCRKVDDYRVCDRFAYDRKRLVYGWAPLMRQHRIPKNADLILALLKRKVISISATGEVEHAFVQMLASVRG